MENIYLALFCFGVVFKGIFAPSEPLPGSNVQKDLTPISGQQIVFAKGVSTLMNHLDGGSQGAVWLASLGQVHVAIKIIAIPHGESEKSKQARLEASREMEIHSLLSKNELVIELYEIKEDKDSFHDYLYLLMELAEGKTLGNVPYSIYMTYKDVLTEVQIAYYVKRLFKALAAVREKGWVYVDVKSTNLLITKAGHLKLADFGWATKDQQKVSWELFNVAKLIYNVLLYLGCSPSNMYLQEPAHNNDKTSFKLRFPGRGLTSRTPSLQLQDLVNALWSYSPRNPQSKHLDYKGPLQKWLGTFKTSLENPPFHVITDDNGNQLYTDGKFKYRVW